MDNITLFNVFCETFNIDTENLTPNETKIIVLLFIRLTQNETLCMN
jgi:hypothetical protein